MVMMDDILCSLITEELKNGGVYYFIIFYDDDDEMGGCFFVKYLLLSHLGNHRKDINTTVRQFLSPAFYIAISQQILRRDNENRIR